MKTKTVSIMLSVCMTIGFLTGCGASADGGGDSSGTTAADDVADDASDTDATNTSTDGTGADTAKTADEEAVPVGEGEVVTIWECNWGGEEYEDTLQRLADQITEMNIDGKGYKVEVTMLSWDNYAEALMTAAVAGTAPDIVCSGSPDPLTYARMGETLDLTPIYDAWVEEGNSIVDNINQAGWDYYTLDGKLVGLPFGVGSQGMVYNKEVFEAAGITELPTDWKELEEVCEKIKDYGVVPIVGAANNASGRANLVNTLFIWANGSYQVTEDDKSNLLAPEVQEAFAEAELFVKNEYIPSAILGYSTDDANRVFLNGEAGIIYTGFPSWIPKEDEDRYDVLPPIHGTSNDIRYGNATYQGYYCFDQSGHPEATLAVMKAWFENNTILFTEGSNSNVPSRQNQAEEVFGDNRLLVDFANAWAMCEDVVPSTAPSKTPPVYHGQLNASGVKGTVFETILTGGDYVEASEKASVEMEAVINANLE